MHCADLNCLIDDYLDGLLSADDKIRVETHLAACPGCQASLALARSMRDAVHELPVPAPAIGMENRLFEQVRQQYSTASPRSHRPAFAFGFITAAVAGLMLWVTSTVFFSATIEQPRIVQIDLNQTQTVRLMLEADHDIENASLSISLPDHMELAGYPGQRQLNWQTDLKKGQNVLALPILALQQGEGKLITQLSYDGNAQSFALILKVSMQGAEHQRFSLYQST